MLCNIDPKVKTIGKKAVICDGVPLTAALVLLLILSLLLPLCTCAGFVFGPWFVV